MSRLERTLENKSKKKKFRFILKLIFIVVLVMNTLVCICVVDISAKIMLGETIKIEKVMYNTQTYIAQTMDEISKLTGNIKNYFNK